MRRSNVLILALLVVLFFSCITEKKSFNKRILGYYWYVIPGKKLYFVIERKHVVRVDLCDKTLGKCNSPINYDTSIYSKISNDTVYFAMDKEGLSHYQIFYYIDDYNRLGECDSYTDPYFCDSADIIRIKRRAFKKIIRNYARNK